MKRRQEAAEEAERQRLQAEAGKNLFHMKFSSNKTNKISIFNIYRSKKSKRNGRRGNQTTGSRS